MCAHYKLFALILIAVLGLPLSSAACEGTSPDRFIYCEANSQDELFRQDIPPSYRQIERESIEPQVTDYYVHFTLITISLLAILWFVIKVKLKQHKVIEYIVTYRKQNYTDEQIRQGLQDSYSTKDIQKAFSSLDDKA